MVRADKAERLERLARQAGGPVVWPSGSERRVPPVSDEELRAARGRPPTPESVRPSLPPAPGTVITPLLRAWRKAREEERAKEREEREDPPDLTS
jgi:hypothetical protein